MSERFISIRHTMGVFALLDRGAAVFGSVLKFASKPIGHGVFVTVARRFDDPADRKRLTPVGTNLNRHLIRSTTNPAGTHFDGRAHVFMPHTRPAIG